MSMAEAKRLVYEYLAATLASVAPNVQRYYAYGGEASSPFDDENERMMEAFKSSGGMDESEMLPTERRQAAQKPGVPEGFDAPPDLPSGLQQKPGGGLQTGTGQDAPLPKLKSETNPGASAASELASQTREERGVMSDPRLAEAQQAAQAKSARSERGKAAAAKAKENKATRQESAIQAATPVSEGNWPPVRTPAEIEALGKRADAAIAKQRQAPDPMRGFQSTDRPAGKGPKPEPAAPTVQQLTSTGSGTKPPVTERQPIPGPMESAEAQAGMPTRQPTQAQPLIRNAEEAAGTAPRTQLAAPQAHPFTVLRSSPQAWQQASGADKVRALLGGHTPRLTNTPTQEAPKPQQSANVGPLRMPGPMETQGLGNPPQAPQRRDIPQQPEPEQRQTVGALKPTVPMEQVGLGQTPEMAAKGQPQFIDTAGSVIDRIQARLQQARTGEAPLPPDKAAQPQDQPFTPAPTNEQQQASALQRLPEDIQAGRAQRLMQEEQLRDILRRSVGRQAMPAAPRTQAPANATIPQEAAPQTPQMTPEQLQRQVQIADERAAWDRTKAARQQPPIAAPDVAQGMVPEAQQSIAQGLQGVVPDVQDEQVVQPEVDQRQQAEQAAAQRAFGPDYQEPQPQAARQSQPDYAERGLGLALLSAVKNSVRDVLTQRKQQRQASAPAMPPRGPQPKRRFALQEDEHPEVTQAMNDLQEVLAEIPDEYQDAYIEAYRIALEEGETPHEALSVALEALQNAMQQGGTE